MEEDMPIRESLPEGTPITMRLDFGYSDMIDLAVSTKAEASSADEERIHDLYVIIFCDGEGEGHVPGQKIYGRYFSYEQLESSLSALDGSPNEGWWVENRTLASADDPVSKTRGAVKISTKVCSSAKLVVIANIDNGVCKLGNENGFGNDMMGYLNGIRNWTDFQKTQVKLTQDVVNRKDLFLMLGMPEDGRGAPRTVNTGDMLWGSTSPTTSYDSEFRVNLRPVDAKVKFKVRINERNADGSVKNEYISAAKAVYWEVDNTPDRCYLFSDYAPAGYSVGTPPAGTVYFNTEPAYFEGTVTEDGSEWYVFSFYMLESRFAAKAHATYYHDREKQVKTDSEKTGYGGDPAEHYVDNGDWVYAMPNAPYVKFDMILTLTPAGVSALGGSVEHALTSDTIYTVHLGDFTNAGFDDYNTYRSSCYTYRVTIANSGSIYAEVKQDNEVQPGQEGYLLLTDDEIVNADCHYEYHAITFTYDPETSPEKFSWYVKTPFTSQVGGGPIKGTKTVGVNNYPTYDPHDTDGTLLDYRWVKFAINVEDPSIGYSTHRVAYPGNNAYDKDWGVGEHGPWDADDYDRPVLMDISQLIQYIFLQTDKEKASAGSSDFKTDSSTGKKVIRATIFIDEYYYEVDPRDESADPQPDPELWRQFVNAQPREMHILSKTVQSRDRKSDVIESSHSVIQQSIQTIYNVFEPDLRSIWGCEHIDEIKQSNDPDWKYWPDGCSDDTTFGDKVIGYRAGADSEIGRENGRLNSAWIWGLYNSRGNGGSYTGRDWRHFLKYEVDNVVPELRNDTDHDSDWVDEEGDTHKYRGMAFSCLTRNRDNNGNHVIDENEVRWYLASSQQLAGIWVGTESLSTSARLYQPAEGQWRAHVVSSTDRLVSWAEEGGGATTIANDWQSGNPYYTWAGEAAATVGESVRCIRNIGTYDDGGVVKDISYAPVTELADKYFSVEKYNSSGVKYEGANAVSTYTSPGDYYVFHFNRLNTNSIREYSPGELPYHDQNSLNNRVYKKMITQSLNQDVSHNKFKVGEESMDEEELAASSSYVLWKDINNNVTRAGTNKYCPAGYRFPNHTEWLLMSLYLPERYLRKNSAGESYSNTGSKATVMPSRTYYDRGYYGSLRGAAWATEYDKVGWIFSNKMHCSESTLPVTHSRCVKDDDQTGVISGKMALEGNVIYPGDKIPINFKFSSTASTFTEATLTLWYTKNGFRTPYDLTSHLKTPTGLQYKGTQEIRMPSLAELGLDVAGLPYDMSLEVEFTNLEDRSGGHELEVSMEDPLEASCTINDAIDGKVYPHDKNKVTLHLSTNTHTLDISDISLKLCYDDVKRDISIPALGSGVKVYNQTNLEIDIPTLAQLSGISESDLMTGKTAHLEATVEMETSNTETLTKTVSSANFTLSHPIVATTFTIDTENDEIYPGDSNTVSLEFSSQGHTPRKLSTVTVRLYDTDGVTPMGESIVNASSINAVTFSSSGSVDIPTLASLGLDVTDLDSGTEYTLRAEVTNEDDLHGILNKTLTLSNPISGSISVPAEYVYSADDNTLGFSVESRAKTSILNNISFKVTYTGIDGNTHNVTSGFTGLTLPSEKTYSGNKTITFPVLSANPATNAVDTSLPVTLTATFTDSGGITKEITCDVPIRSHINVPVLQIPSDYTGTSLNHVFPVKAKLGDAIGGYAISAMKLQWKKNGETMWTTDTYDFDESDSDFQTVSDASTRASLSLSTGSYINYRAMTICSTDGTAAYSHVWSMWLARYNYSKSGRDKWSFPIYNLDIPGGDFIQASITETGGVDETNGNSVNKYELIGFGVGEDESVFYPAQKSSAPGNAIHVQRRETNKIQVYGWWKDTAGWRYKKFGNYTNPIYINVLFNSNGLYYQNGNLFDPTNVDNRDNDASTDDDLTLNVYNLIHATSMVVGSAQGVERPLATYHFVRVVRQYEIPEP